MGQAPTVQLDMSMQYGANTMLITFFSAISNKISFASKLDDFALYDMDFDGFANSANYIYRVASSQ
jgi:ABC-type uncharacterized transport system substrate-binding protein